MPFALSTWIVASLYLYALCGRLLWRDIERHDVIADPREHAICPLTHANNNSARIVRAFFIAFWPGLLALGFVMSSLKARRG